MKAVTVSNSPVVTTSYGDVVGVFEEDLSVFRGIPYAAPPIGGLRWQSARPHEGWAGIRSAENYGPSALQPFVPGGSPILGEHGSPPFDEDCLSLNIWTPSADDKRRPVLVWIHGGGLLIGSGNIPYYAGDTFAKNGDLVVVTINYRLGALGYLSGMGDRENLWLDDQAVALRWIVDNIEAFGGDPNAITLLGQSGGALSIGGLVQHPTSRGLFHRAILQSIPLGIEFQTPSAAFERTQKLATLLGHDDVEALRNEPGERLVEGSLGVLIDNAAFGNWPLAFLPVIDEDSIPVHPLQALAESDVELLVGWTEDEASFAFALDPQYADTSQSQVLDWLGSEGEEALGIYGAYTSSGRSTPKEVLSGVVSDNLFRRSALDLVEKRAAVAPVYAYEFRFDSPAFDGRLGATHCLDLPFTFNNVDKWSGAGFIQGIEEVVFERIGTSMHKAFISFVVTGDPTHEGFAWPKYTSEQGELLLIDQNIRVGTEVGRPWQSLDGSRPS